MSDVFDLRGRSVFVAGHRGMVGQALVRRLAREPVEILTATRDELDLTRQAAVEAWMAEHRPEVVVIAAAKVGGILANSTCPVDFLEQNLLIQTNLIRASFETGVKKLLFLGSSCIYPRECPQPIREEYLLTGPLEPTNEPYAIAKIAGIRLCQAYRRQHGADFISAMPTNLYGPGDNYDLETSHVVAALLRKMHEAKARGDGEVVVWGTGTPRREFLQVDDLADACVFLLERYSNALPVNVGTGEDITIRELAELVAEVVGFEGRLVFDATKPDGTPRKVMDVGRLREMGWQAGTGLREGLQNALAAMSASLQREAPSLRVCEMKATA
ncbi:GDP-L-fucose synthase [Geminicoccaceae bacterium 1502E]|nr:GDP-L-fucose synthase [Geminicoccaceae bacterium 1502E]